MVYFILSNGLTGRGVVLIVTMAILCVMFWYAAVPYLCVRFGRPVSRNRFLLRMILYTAVLILLHTVWFFAESAEAYGFDPTMASTYPPELMNVVAIIALIVSITACAAAVISYNVFKHTRGVDVRLPEDYRRVKPVKATVTQVDSLTAVEYGGNKYYMAKNFHCTLRDHIRVRIIEGRENCYLA
ncbi:MAG: hypothetical protein IKS17_09820 [Firmicutes bacterium]|nr:hypothetical protein [Bacillota bacterium]